MSLFHTPFKRYSNEYTKHYENYALIIKERNYSQDSLLDELGESLTIIEYKKARNSAWLLSKRKLKNYTKVKKKLAKEHSFFGRNSFKFWIYVFGIILLGFYFSIKSLIDDYRKPIRTGHEVISIIGMSVCLFWFYHLFFKTASDFYTETYLVLKLLIALAIGVFISRLVKYYATKEGIIKTLIDLVLRVKTKHYREIAIKALYAEKYDKSMNSIDSVKDQTNKLDKDIADTINKLTI